MHDRPLKSSVAFAGLLALFVVGAGCIEGDSSPSDDTDELGEAEQAVQSAVNRGKKLFKKETFDGNDRTCATCHRGKDGTISPAEVEEIFAENPDDPLFRELDSDDGEGESYDRLREHATVRVRVPLPPFLKPLDDLEATHVVLNRAVPTVNDMALEPVLMWDGRAPDLEEQALGAIHDHAEPGREPTEEELADIAAFQESRFTNKQLQRYAEGGPEPELPQGQTESEKRGRAFFLPDGMCGHCHGGPMLNESTEFHPSGVAGLRFDMLLVGELEQQPNELREWAIVNPETNEVEFVFPFRFPDPGRILTTWDFNDLTMFKIPTLWGVKDTAPYFHDNSAKDLETMVRHYTILFDLVGSAHFTEQDEQDIVAYIKLL